MRRFVKTGEPCFSESSRAGRGLEGKLTLPVKGSHFGNHYTRVH